MAKIMVTVPGWKTLIGAATSFSLRKTTSCTITVKMSGNMDAKRGARYVVRYSKLYDCSFIQNARNRRRSGQGMPGYRILQQYL